MLSCGSMGGPFTGAIIRKTFPQVYVRFRVSNCARTPFLVMDLKEVEAFHGPACFVPTSEVAHP